MRREYFEKENNVMGFNNGNAVFDYWFNSVQSKTQNISFVVIIEGIYLIYITI